MAFGWTRTNFGLVSFQDTTASGLSTAQSKIDADCGVNGSTTATTNESTYQTDYTSLTGSDANLKMNVSNKQVPSTGSNPGM